MGVSINRGPNIDPKNSRGLVKRHTNIVPLNAHMIRASGYLVLLQGEVPSLALGGVCSRPWN